MSTGVPRLAVREQTQRCGPSLTQNHGSGSGSTGGWQATTRRAAVAPGGGAGGGPVTRPTATGRRPGMKGGI